jgi:hypothetical protein
MSEYYSILGMKCTLTAGNVVLVTNYNYSLGALTLICNELIVGLHI